MKLTLRITLWTAAIALLGALVFFQNRTPENEVTWSYDLAEARAAASESDRPMLLYFTADWCPPCQQMKRSVWPDDAVEQAVNAHVVPVYVDVDSEMGQQLGFKYEVNSIPTFLFTDATGEPLRDASDAELRTIGGLPKEALIDLVTTAANAY